MIWPLTSKGAGEMGLNSRYSIVIAVFAVACIGSFCGFAQGTLEDYQRSQRLLPVNLPNLVLTSDMTPNWIEKTNRFWYRKAVGRGSEFILVDADKNTTGPAFDQSRLAAALSGAARHEYRAVELPFVFFDFIEGGKAIRFQVQNVSWTCNLTEYQCQEEPATRDRTGESVSPNKRWAAYVKDHNLWLRNLSTGETVQLTNDGAPGWNYASPLPSLRVMVNQGTEEVTQAPAVFWAPDSSRLVTYRLDSRNAGHFTSLQFVPADQLRPKAFTYVYPLPGEVLAKAAPIIFEVPSGKRIEVKTSPLEIPFQGGPGFVWFQDSKRLRFNWTERGYKSIELRVVEAETGEQKTMVREHSDEYVDPGLTQFRFLDAGNEILCSSERDGWNHLYLFSQATAQLENQVTSGNWAVRRIEHVDEKNRRVYFMAGGREKNEDPYHTHLY